MLKLIEGINGFFEKRVTYNCLQAVVKVNMGDEIQDDSRAGVCVCVPSADSKLRDSCAAFFSLLFLNVQQISRIMMMMMSKTKDMDVASFGNNK